MSERLWSYTELKYIMVNGLGCSSEELAEKVNGKFHDGEVVRTARDVEKIKSGSNIFTRKKRR